MISLTTPAASAVLGIPKSHNMADVIDALKRLERVGSEHSKTTEKLLKAANELAEKIIAQYAAQPGERISIRQPGMSLLRPDESSGQPFNYWIENCRLVRGPLPGVQVAQNRDAALGFSKDVANGLLDYISEDLVKRTSESASAIRPLSAKSAGDVASAALKASGRLQEAGPPFAVYPPGTPKSKIEPPLRLVPPGAE